MPRAVLLPLAIAGVFAVPGEAATQLPPPQPPPAVITLRSVKLLSTTLTVRLQYERAGTKPTEYRASSSRDFAGASWVTFTEGATKSTVEGRTTWITGVVTPAGVFHGTCGSQQIRVRAFLQFRGRNQLLQATTSGVAGDSVCIPLV